MSAGRSELRWIIVCSLLVVALTSLPYLVGWLSAGPELRFTGFVLNPFDGNSYLAKMRQGEAGGWLFHLPYTSEAHEGAFIFTFYIALGHLSRLLGLPAIWTFHLARAICGLVLLLTAYLFVARLTGDRTERRAAFWLVALSSGLGWLGMAFGLFPVDLWVPEAITFYSILANPHFPLAMALMLLIFWKVVWREEGRAVYLTLALAALALAMVQPFALLIVGAALACYLALRLARRGLTVYEVVASLTVGLASAPVILYDFYVSRANPALAAWSAQNLTPSPPLWDYLLGYGLLLPLAVAGAYVIYKEGSAGGLLLLSWVGATALSLYVPFGLQRRFVTGLHLPLAILAAFGLCRLLLPRLAPALRSRALIWSVVLTAVGNAVLVLMLSVGSLGHDPRFYMTGDEAAAMAWLRDNADAGDVVISAPRTGTLIPAWGGGKVFYGHPFETVDAPKKEALAREFFAGKMEGTAWDDLRRQYRITLVFYGPAEGTPEEGPPAQLRSLPVAFQSGAVSIYRLAQPITD